MKKLLNRFLEEIDQLKQDQPFWFEIKDEYFDGVDLTERPHDSELDDDYYFYIDDISNHEIQSIYSLIREKPEFKELPCAEDFMAKHMDDESLETIYEKIRDELVFSESDSYAGLGIYPRQFDNFNQEGTELGQNVLLLQKAIENEDFSHYEPHPAIKQLFESQGFEPKDLIYVDDHPESKFLRSFHEEVVNVIDGLCFLGYLIQIDGKDYFDLLDSCKGKDNLCLSHSVKPAGKVKINPNKDNAIGLMNLTWGSGSCCGIMLDREIELDLQESEIQTLGKSNYGYSPFSIYGDFDIQKIKIERKEEVEQDK